MLRIRIQLWIRLITLVGDYIAYPDADTVSFCPSALGQSVHLQDFLVNFLNLRKHKFLYTILMRVRRGKNRVRREKYGCGVAIIGCGVAKIGCGVEKTRVRRGKNRVRRVKIGCGVAK